MMKKGLAAAAVGAALFWPGLRVRRYRVLTRKTAAPFRLALLADLHSARYGAGQTELLRVLLRQKPDAVLLAGDMAPDAGSLQNLDELLRALEGRFPVFYVSGNHEVTRGREKAVKRLVAARGGIPLAGNSAVLRRGEEAVSVCGVDDPEAELLTGGEPWLCQLFRCAEERKASGRFTVLLTHRPERMQLYASCGFDLVLAGHVHGGQVRIPPFVNGLLAPSQGIFPQYAGGFYLREGTAMVVSRGLARKLPRFCNPPEVVIVDILPAP